MQTKQSAAFDVLLNLFQPPVGTIRFDAMTRTKTVEGLVAALDLDGIKKYTTWLFTFVIDGDMPSQSGASEEDAEMDADDDAEEETKAKSLEYRRLWAIDQLGLLVRKHAKALPLEAESGVPASPEYTCITRILQFMLVHGFTKVLKTTKKSDIEALRFKPQEPFSTSFQQAVRSRFFSALSHIITVNTKCRSEPWIQQCLNTLLALQKDTKHVSPLASQDAIDSSSSTVKLLSQVKSLVRITFSSALAVFLI